ncbi:DUF3168 domain-containing protein [Hansschlegelia quercus]|uniref:DUF3168 domain-containing protein n=1 Tax=Hansschlegelia quercus TaxID=2528245 RepID=A0A4Q9GE34_9HYPH|nr:DUF3168 domain-containing protein [Hansschlegelia quercus]TBN48669.1 DUF3168 domain-containing protein [Hansschlegelia quercus]
MSAASLALRIALRQRLIGDAALSALLGGPRIYDEPPRGAAPPYVALGVAVARDLSGDLAPAEEHELAVEIWSREGGLSEALKAADRLARAADGPALALTGHRVASFDWIATEAAKIAEDGLRRATVTFRAVTEPAE